MSIFTNYRHFVLAPHGYEAVFENGDHYATLPVVGFATCDRQEYHGVRPDGRWVTESTEIVPMINWFSGMDAAGTASNYIGFKAPWMSDVEFCDIVEVDVLPIKRYLANGEVGQCNES